MRLLPFAASLTILVCVACPQLAAQSSKNHNLDTGAPIDNTGSLDLSGSTFVPLDSWVYPALRRLAALGFVPDQNSSMAPWTRTECKRQIAEAHSFVDVAPVRESETVEGAKLLAGLDQEFPIDYDAPDHESAVTVESAYTRVGILTGTPLRDSYHFGQTVVNDFGRRFDSGFNNITGASAYGNYGHFFGYLRAEYQSAPGRDGYDQAVRQFISRVDANPIQPATPVSSTNRVDVLEAYVGAQFGFENISFGKEALWWGPGQDSAFAFSNNAEPFYMLNFAQSRPLVLPSILRHFGKIRTQFLFGELQGHHWPVRPLVNAQKISFDLTDNFEVSFTRSTFWGGVGHPVTLHSFKNSLVSFASTGTFRYGDRTDPGDRHSGFDFRYRLPLLRRYVTIYSDSYADDEPNPVDSPRRSAWGPGIYISHLPGLRGLDLRGEYYSTLLYPFDHGGQFMYFNNQYHDAYTNDGNLMGSWVGRDARAYTADVGYWLTARTHAQAQFRQMRLAEKFVPAGGTQSDASFSLSWGLTPNLLASGSVQYERYFVPILGPKQSDTTTFLQITYNPHFTASTR